jgi:hypothetical protein
MINSKKLLLVNEKCFGQSIFVKVKKLKTEAASVCPLPAAQQRCIAIQKISRA